MNMLGLAKRVKARFLQASTSEVYGDPSIHPQPETYWGYVNPIGIRSCYDEGKRAAETLAFDYLIDGIVRLMEQEETVGPMNIGNPHEFTMKELAQLVIEVTGSSSKIIYQPLPGDDPKQRQPNITQARDILGWEPR